MNRANLHQPDVSSGRDGGGNSSGLAPSHSSYFVPSLRRPVRYGSVPHGVGSLSTECPDCRNRRRDSIPYLLGLGALQALHRLAQVMLTSLHLHTQMDTGILPSLEYQHRAQDQREEHGAWANQAGLLLRGRSPVAPLCP